MPTYSEALAAKRAADQARLDDVYKQVDCFANSPLYGMLDVAVSGAAVLLKTSPIIHIWPPPPGQRDQSEEIAANVLFGAATAAIAVAGIAVANPELVPAAPGIAAFVVDQGGYLFGGKPLDFNRQLPFEVEAKKAIRGAFAEDRKKRIIKALSNVLGRDPTKQEVIALCKTTWDSQEDLEKEVRAKKNKQGGYGALVVNLQARTDLTNKIAQNAAPKLKIKAKETVQQVQNKDGTTSTFVTLTDAGVDEDLTAKKKSGGAWWLLLAAIPFL